jgi:DNA polymerase-3 subunit chi
VSRVDFYVLSQDAPDARQRFACRLAEKAAEQGHRVYVQTASPGDAQRLDDLLWTFNERGFLPHELCTGAGPAHPKVMVLVGNVAAPAGHRELLINLTDMLPAELESYARIAEIVGTDPLQKQLSRDRYKVYRERGCELESHNV